MPSNGANQFYGLGAVGQEDGYIGTGDTLLIEPLYKMAGSRVNSLGIAVADNTSLYCWAKSVSKACRVVAVAVDRPCSSAIG